MNTIDDMYTKVKQYAKYTLHIAIAVGLVVTANSTHTQYKEYLAKLTDARCASALSTARDQTDALKLMKAVTGPLGEPICFSRQTVEQIISQQTNNSTR
jgi:hypothetical protein